MEQDKVRRIKNRNKEMSVYPYPEKQAICKKGIECCGKLSPMQIIWNDN